jgi:site-specific DNA-methyltransferase (adenine-specific)
MQIEEMINKIFLETPGQFEYVKEIPDKSIDMILCDLPYGTTACKWDTVIPFDLLWSQYNRIIKDNGAIVLTAAQPFTSALVMSNIKMFKYCWVWDKHIPRGFQTAKYRPMNRHEDVVVFGIGKLNYYPIKTKRDKPITVKNYSKKDKISSNDIGKYNDSNKSFTYTDRNPDTIIEGCWEKNAGKFHPTQKPVSLFEYLIKTYTKENEIVLDNCMGGGTTALACKNTNRNFICMEIYQEYIDIANKRLKGEI